MIKVCTSCGQEFEVTDEDLAFYGQISPEFNGTRYTIPAPTLCPACRLQRRMAWCNEQHLHHNTCAHTGKPVISQLPASNPRPVWNIWDWWSDACDAMVYGREVELNRSFMEQLHELELVCPHACVNTDLDNENSEYTHHAGHEKNCYLLFHASYAENCLYGYGIKKTLSCCDNYYCHESELCYECIDVQNCYNCKYAQECQNCSDCTFVRDCIGCQNCLLCTGLRNKKFCILNEQLSEEEYKKRLAETDLGSHQMLQQLEEKFAELQLAHTYKHLKNELVENCTGDHLLRAKDCHECFDCSDIEGSKYCTQLQLDTKFCHDIYQFGLGIELCYDCSMIGYNIYNCHFSYDLLEQCSDLLYCITCVACKNCFGCFGLKHKQYCILNKQYTKEEYEELVPKIIERMRADGEWGEFLPVQYSQSPYNETSAQQWYPLAKEDVEARGWRYEESDESANYLGPKVELPDNIAEVDDNICEQILTCEATGKPYKIVPQELEYYRTQHLPLPRKCFIARHADRFGKRNKRVLYERQCDQCEKLVLTTLEPGRPEKILCEECYLAAIH